LNDDGDFFVGTDKNDLVVAMGGLKRLSVERAEIKRLRIHPGYQRRGYGQQLLTRLESRAVELGFSSLYLDTLTNQDGAQLLFRKNGYEPKGNAVIDGFNVNQFEKSLASSLKPTHSLDPVSAVNEG
jgi:ribosomal protein S18 acetylase RimI-like enzyme